MNIFRGGGTDFGLGGQKIFYRRQKKIFCTIFFPQGGFPSNIGWAAAHPAHPGPTPLDTTHLDSLVSSYSIVSLIVNDNIENKYKMTKG